MAINFANNSSLANITTLPASISGGGLTLVSSQTASSSASLEFSIDDSYDSYMFKFINIHPSTNANFVFQVNASGQTGFNETITSTFFLAAHQESDGSATLGYNEDNDKAQETTFQRIGKPSSADDSNTSGYVILYNPSSTTFVKHFMSRGIHNNGTTQQDEFSAGYFNTTSAITEISFKMSSGNIDDGIIKMYGVA